MAVIKAFTRRDVLKLGGTAALASAGVTTMSFSVQGASAPINVVTSNSTLTNTLFNILADQKYLEKFGVAIETLNVSDGSKTVPALLNGGSDLCVINGLGLAIASIAKGATMKIVGSNCLSPQSAVYSAKSEIKSIKDLEGKVVGTNALGALPHQLMVTIMQKKGVDINKVTFRNVGGSNTDILRAVIAGTVDAGPSGIDVFDDQEKYGVHSLSDGALWTELPEFTYQGAYASNDAIANKRDGLVRVLASFVSLFRFIQAPDSKAAFAKARERAAGKDEPKAAADTWNFFQKYKPYAEDLAFSEERVNYLQKLNMQFAAQDAIVPYAKLTDMSLAADAVKLVGSVRGSFAGRDRFAACELFWMAINRQEKGDEMMQVWGRLNSINTQKVLWLGDELKLNYEQIDAGRGYGHVDTPEYYKLKSEPEGAHVGGRRCRRLGIQRDPALSGVEIRCRERRVSGRPRPPRHRG